MILFLLFSFHLFFFLVCSLPWGAQKTPDVPQLVSVFLKGVLLFFPAFVVILITRRIFGFSWSGAWLFISLLLRDQLVPLLAGLGGFLIVKKKLDLPIFEEGIFLGVLSFFCGFLAMINVADLVRTWGSWDAYVLFLLPFQRLAAVVFISLLARRFYPWEGREAVLYAIVVAGVAVALSICGFLFVESRPLWSILLTAVPVAAAVIAFAMKFPRALRA
jgi:hypothetical protein